MDLSLIVPLCVLSGVLLHKKRPWGYLLSSIGMLEFLTMGTAVGLMAPNVARKGLAIEIAELVVFLALTLANLVMVAFLLESVEGKAREGP
jgi:hypothetical protein